MRVAALPEHERRQVADCDELRLLWDCTRRSLTGDTGDTTKGRQQMAASKRQTTMAKLAREQSVRERRARKQEKRDARKLAKAEGTPIMVDSDSMELSGSTGTPDAPSD